MRPIARSSGGSARGSRNGQVPSTATESGGWCPGREGRRSEPARASARRRRGCAGDVVLCAGRWHRRLGPHGTSLHARHRSCGLHAGRLRRGRPHQNHDRAGVPHRGRHRAGRRRASGDRATGRTGGCRHRCRTPAWWSTCSSPPPASSPRSRDRPNRSRSSRESRRRPDRRGRFPGVARAVPHRRQTLSAGTAHGFGRAARAQEMNQGSLDGSFV